MFLSFRERFVYGLEFFPESQPDTGKQNRNQDNLQQTPAAQVIPAIRLDARLHYFFEQALGLFRLQDLSAFFSDIANESV